MADSDPDTSALSAHEAELADRSRPLPAHVVHEIIRDEGQSELERKAGQILWSGLAAGLSMGFSFLVEAQLRAGLPDAPWRPLLASFGYTVGFVIVVLGRQQLFTESTLTAVLPALTARDAPTWLKVVRLWALVLLANIAGTWLFAALLAYGRPYPPETAPALAALAQDSLGTGFVPTLLKGVVAGWLIALMVWLLPSARTARLFIIMLITYVVALGRLPHIIAGSAEAAFAVLAGGAAPGRYALDFFLPTLLGNSIGGVVFTAMLNHAPVSEQVRDEG